MPRTLSIFLLAFITLASLHAADDTRLTAVTAADQARVESMTHPSREKLDAIFSGDLHYAHSNGVVDTKASFIEVLTRGRTRYLRYDYEERTFTFPLADIALMTGRVKIKAATASGEMDNTLSFLAVWRNENGRWRFLAWQSCKIPSPANP